MNSQQSEAADLFIESRSMMNGVGVHRDGPGSVDSLRKSAEKGSPAAMFMLAQLYENGLLIPTSYREYHVWLRKAAECAHRQAMSVLGHYLLWGAEGFVRNDQEGYMWIQRAAALGHAEAAETLDARPKGTQGLPALPTMTPWVLNPQSRAELFLSAFEHMNGIGIEPNQEKTFLLMKSAAEQGIVEAMDFLSHFYGVGFGVDADQVESVRWVKNAVDAGHSCSMGKLGTWYYHGALNLPEDEKLGFDLMKRSADLGNPEALVFIAKKYYFEQKFEQALGLVREAANANHIEAIMMLAQLHLREGAGLTQDKPLVSKLLRRACKYQEPNAPNFLLENGHAPFKIRQGGITPIAAEYTTDDERAYALSAFAHGNWGQVTALHWELNDKNVEEGNYVYARYPLDQQRTLEITADGLRSFYISLQEESNQVQERERWNEWLIAFIMAPM